MRSLIMTLIYVQLFANSCNNGFINLSAKAKGEINWVKENFIDTEENDEMGFLLSADKYVFVISAKKIVSFDAEGNLLWERERWIKSPVCIRKDKIYFTSPESKSTMQSVDFNNQIILDEFWMPDVGKESYLTLFEPDENSLIAQVQYKPDPNTGEKSFIIYKVKIDGMGYEWKKEFLDETGRVIPLINMERNYLVSSTSKEAVVFNLENVKKDAEPSTIFPLPLGEKTSWLSAENEGNLSWVGKENLSVKLVVTDLNGNILWNWESDEFSFSREASPLLPAVIAKDVNYILTPKKLFAVKEGKLLWHFNSELDDFTFVTATAENIILTSGNYISLLDLSGKKLWQLKVDEPITSAPVIDETGKIYTACKTKLYSIK